MKYFGDYIGVPVFWGKHHISYCHVDVIHRVLYRVIWLLYRLQRHIIA